MQANEVTGEDDHPIPELSPIPQNTPIAPAHGIAAMALGFALKYHDVSTIRDGTLYQQYKLEQRNIREIGLDDVFETAIRIEKHLLASSDRISALIVEALEVAVEEHETGKAGEEG